MIEIWFKKENEEYPSCLQWSMANNDPMVFFELHITVDQISHLNIYGDELADTVEIFPFLATRKKVLTVRGDFAKLIWDNVILMHGLGESC